MRFVCFLNLQQMDSDKAFLLASEFYFQGLPTPGTIHMYKMKKVKEFF